MSGPKVLYAEFTALPGRGDDVAALIAGLAQDVRREAGKVTFRPTRRADRPDAFVVWEEYADDDAFHAHLSAGYSARFNAALGPLIVEDGSRLTWLDAV